MPPSLSEVQAAFAAALIDPRRTVPPGILGREGLADDRRFAVYRNNVVVSLVDALQARFAVTCRLVGSEFFRAMARAYVGTHLPRTPLLMQYGDDLPDFVAAFEPAASVPYLADVARLERAWSEAYHAPDAAALPPETLTTRRAAALLRSRLRLHPSLRLLRSPHPVATVWWAHQTAAEPAPPAAWPRENVLVVRPDAEVLVHLLPDGAFEFVAALAAGASLEVAAAAGRSRDGGFDAGEHLTGLVGLGAVADVEASSGEAAS